jgi:hypothetical protein
MSSEDSPGTLILADEFGRNLTWHHSVAFDGSRHTTACGREVDTDDIRDVEMQPPREAWRKHVTPNSGCPACHDSVHEDRAVRTDGGHATTRFKLRPCRSRRCGGRVTMHRRIDDRDPPAWRCTECLTTFEALQETLVPDGGDS